MKRLLSRLVVGVVAVVLIGLPAPARSADRYHPSWHFLLDAVAFGWMSTPPGMNDWSCKLTPQHPRPVILVHGTFASASMNWASYSQAFANAGYCVYGFSHGSFLPEWFPYRIGGLRGIPPAAQQLADFVTRVRTATGAAQVDLVGHSQGGTINAYYAKILGGAPNVAHVINLGSPYYPPQTDPTVKFWSDISFGFVMMQMALIPEVAAIGPKQVFDDLNAGGIGVPGPKYTNITTFYDEFSWPREIAVMPPQSGVDITTIKVQDVCTNDYADHISLAADPNVFAMMTNILSARPATPVTCREVHAFTGVVD